MNLDLAPDAIAGYRLIKPLGKGGMATVYLALQHSLRREVALKVMAPHFAQDGDFAERFLAEAQLTARLTHPNIMIVHDVGCCGPHYYFATELLPGGTLRERLPTLTTTVDKLRVVRGIARGLGYAHQQRVVHRDIKPVNIMFRDEVQPVITDFGIAKAQDASKIMTQAGTVIGTPHYMSPEQAQGLPLDGRSDLYSLGIMLYEMLTGALPYTATEPLVVMLMHLQQPKPRLPAEHEALQPLLDRLLAKLPEQRYRDAEELVEALTPHLGRAPTGRITPIAEEWRPSRPNESSAAVAPIDTPRTFEVPDPLKGATMIHDPAPAALPAAAVRSERSDPHGGPGANPKVAESRSDPHGPERQAFVVAPPPIPQPAARSRWPLLAAAIALPLVLAIVLWPRPAVIEPEPDQTSAITGPMLLQVRSQIGAGAYFRPPGDSAYDLLQRLLLAAPTDPDVLASTRELTGAVASTVRRHWQAGERTEALSLLREARDRLPNDTALSQLAADLQTAIEATPNTAGPAPVGARDPGQLLARAEQLRAAAQLTLPPGDNAVELYQQVLRLDPANQQASAALKQIALDYLRVADTFRDRKRPDQALQQVRNGLKADPLEPRLLKLEQELLGLIGSAEVSGSK